MKPKFSKKFLNSTFLQIAQNPSLFNTFLLYIQSKDYVKATKSFFNFIKDDKNYNYNGYITKAINRSFSKKQILKVLEVRPDWLEYFIYSNNSLTPDY